MQKEIFQQPEELVVEESYPNQEFKTHKLSGIKNKFRNKPCPCKSGKKFKKCCIGKVD
jgi:uncharacterized protein YecA (UPF0149 family)